MLQNVRVTVFTVSELLELLRENQQGEGGDKITHPSPTQVRVKD